MGWKMRDFNVLIRVIEKIKSDLLKKIKQDD